LIRRYKKETLENGPSNLIDYNMEERLAEKMERRNHTWFWPF